MKIWITRPEMSTICSRGISGVDLWCVQPTYNAAPRGARDLRIYANLPIGWEVIDAQGVDITAQCSVLEGKLLRKFPEIENALWEAIVMDIDGRLPVGDEIKRWIKRCFDDIEAEEARTARFCFEVDAPPELWFRIALKNGWEHQTSASAHYQATFDAWDSDPKEDTQYRRIALDDAGMPL